MSHKTPRTGPVEETAVVRIGTTPGEQYGWECADCDIVTGLMFGSSEEAAQRLAEHLARHGPRGVSADASRDRLIELAHFCLEHSGDDLVRILNEQDGDEALDLLTVAKGGPVARALLWNHLAAVHSASERLEGALASLREYVGQLVAEEVARQSTPSV